MFLLMHDNERLMSVECDGRRWRCIPLSCIQQVRQRWLQQQTDR